MLNHCDILAIAELHSAQHKFATSNMSHPLLDDVQYEDEVYAVIGAAIEVQKVLGQGFSELVYHEALCRELGLRGIPFESEKEIEVVYKGTPLTRTYRADIICYGDIILELKMVHALLPEHTAQVLNYLKATGKPLGVLINFGETPLGRRIVPNHISK